MKMWTKVTLGALGLLLGGTALAVLGLWRLVSAGCDNDVLSDVPAPGDRYRAVVFQRNCGVTTGLSTQVSVIRGSRRLPNEGGNAFVADDSTALTEPDDVLLVEARWIDSA